MKDPIGLFLSVILCGGVLAWSPPAFGALGDCGQPSSIGSSPSASDAQELLKTAVGQPVTKCNSFPDPLCVCDVNNSGSINTTDALILLRKAVGQPVLLNCPPCNDPPPACTSAIITTGAGSDLDSGWTGVAHNSDIVVGATLTVRVKRECSGATANVECRKDSDCIGNGTCVATCNCWNDKSCEISGPTGGRKCLNNLADCEANRCIVAGSTTGTVCATNSDCIGGTCTGSPNCNPGISCVSVFGPPLPLASSGTPVCVVTYFDGPLTGTADSGTGEGVASANLRSRIYLGNAGLTKPCPVCGPLAASPEVGDVFTCDGGTFPGASCTVEGVSADFGGTSTDCPPLVGTFSSSLAIRFQEITTGTSTKTAQLPCASYGFLDTTTLPVRTCLRGSEPGTTCTVNSDCADQGTCNNPTCTDTKAACTSNSDCMRCTGDPAVACTSNDQCSGNGSCAEAPDQPVTCGHWCNCGLCGNDPSLPCFQTSDCPQGLTCTAPAGSGTQLTAPQTKNNNCSSDKFICGLEDSEKCANTFIGKCSLADFRDCVTDDECGTFDAGVCVIEQRPCFEPRITRSGEPSPLGQYCAFEDKTCTSNADCTGTDDFCMEDSSRPTTVALFCVPTSASQAVNSAGGIMGPGAISLKSLLEVCRCGDGKVGCDEQCDDSNTVGGDGCDDFCQDE